MLQIQTGEKQASQGFGGGHVFRASVVTAFSGYPSSAETSNEQPMARAFMADVHFSKQQTLPDNKLHSLVRMKMTPCAKVTSLAKAYNNDDGLTCATPTSQWKFCTFGSMILYDPKKTLQHMKGFLVVDAHSKEDPLLKTFTYLRKHDENE